MTAVIRHADEGDVDAVQLGLYLAITWDKPDAPPLERAVQHPELARFWEGWGRRGDIGVVARSEHGLVGSAFGRLFTETDHSHGFVDEKTPEIGIGVVEHERGKGLGRRLMLALEEEALRNEIDALSLSVNISNPACALYESLGYVELDRDDASIRMMKALPSP